MLYVLGTETSPVFNLCKKYITSYWKKEYTERLFISCDKYLLFFVLFCLISYLSFSLEYKSIKLHNSCNESETHFPARITTWNNKSKIVLFN